MSMKRNSPAIVRGRFQLFHGNGESERLDRFLAEADPLCIAPPRAEKRRLGRRRLGRDRRIWAGVLFLSLASLAPLSPAKPGRQAFPQREKALALVSQGQRLTAEDRDAEALGDFSLAVQLAPNLADAWEALAASQSRGFQSTQAERAYQRALSLEPDHPGALHGLGNLYLRRGEEEKAERIWLRGGLDQQLARLYLLQGRFHQAEVHLAKLSTDGPANELVNRMARAARARRLDPALRSFLEPEPTGLSPWSESGWRLLQQKRYEEAASSFARALADFPHDVNALSGMGSVLLAQERPAAARSYFEQALDRRGDHLRSLNGLASCLRSEGRTGEAIAVWQQAAELYPGVNDATPGLAWTYFGLQDYRRAAYYLAPLARKHPHDSRVLAALDVSREKLEAVRSSRSQSPAPRASTPTGEPDRAADGGTSGWGAKP
jgi:tetratricopeptide (TPR) repeat protein